MVKKHIAKKRIGKLKEKILNVDKSIENMHP